MNRNTESKNESMQKISLRLPTDFRSLHNEIIDGKNCMLKNLPTISVQPLDGHAYVSILELISYLLLDNTGGTKIGKDYGGIKFGRVKIGGKKAEGVSCFHESRHGKSIYDCARKIGLSKLK